MPIMAPEAFYPKASVSIYRSSRTMCTNFSWSRLHDRYTNTQRDLINDVMNWLSGSSQGGLCQYIPGDVNGNGEVNSLDIVFAVNYLKGGEAPPMDCYLVCPSTPNPFYAAGDVNGNCTFNGIDITYFVRYLKLQVPRLLYCPDCPPGPQKLLDSESGNLLTRNPTNRPQE